MEGEYEKILCHDKFDDPLLEQSQKSTGCFWCINEQHYRKTLGSIIGIGSLLLNIFLLTSIFQTSSELRAQRSRYIGMEFDTVGTISYHGSYGPSNHNETDRVILWENLDGSSGQVAISKSWARSKDLPPSSDFVWDKTEEVYTLRGFHGQHCLRKLYRWVAISYHNGTQLDQYDHVVHCLDALLQDVRCWADDTLMRFTPEGWGEGQDRQCRDWNKLEEWAAGHNACYTYLNETQGVKSQFDRYKWCPKGSPYETRMRSFLGLGNDWDGSIPKDIDSLPRYWQEF